MSDENTNIAETVERLTLASQEPSLVEEHPYLILNQGQTVADLESYLPAPLRNRTNITFISTESFNTYVNIHKDTGSRVELQRSGNAVAVLDGSQRDQPEWEQHRASFRLTYSERWLVWDSQNRKTFTQKQFAEFIEDNTPDFFAPSGGEMLDIARTLEGEVSSKFTAAEKDFSTGDVKFSFEKTTTAKAGSKGDLTVPSKFTIMVPILEGETPRNIELRLRWEITGDGRPTFSFEILKRTQLRDEVRRSIFAAIKNNTGVEIYLVP